MQVKAGAAHAYLGDVAAAVEEFNVVLQVSTEVCWGVLAGMHRWPAKDTHFRRCFLQLQTHHASCQLCVALTLIRTHHPSLTCSPHPLEPVDVCADLYMDAGIS